MNKLAESELAAIAGGDGDLPPSYLMPVSHDASIAAILALFSPRWVAHQSD